MSYLKNNLNLKTEQFEICDQILHVLYTWDSTVHIFFFVKATFTSFRVDYSSVLIIQWPLLQGRGFLTPEGQLESFFRKMQRKLKNGLFI